MAALAARVFVIVACLLYVASIPGAALRTLVIDVTTAPLPESVRERDGALDVFVTAESGGAPIRGARARAYAWLSGRAHFAAESTTDDTGRARLDRLPRAEHWIVVEAEGYARASRMVVIVEGARRLDLSLGPARELEVEVKSESGAPVAGAELEVRAADPFPVGAKTDAQGHARVGRLGDGPFSVLVRAAGFEEVRRRGVAGDRPLVVTLSRQGTVVAKVTGPDGEPVDRARVQIAGPSLWPARESMSDAKGEVRIGGLSAGVYTLRALKGALVSPTEIAVSLEKGQEREVALHLAAGVMVSIEIVEEGTGDEVANADVTLAEDGLSAFPLHARSDKKGRAQLGPIARGPATLSVSAEGYVQHSVGLGAGQSTVKVELSRGATLIGKVTDARGYTVDGATIRVIGTDVRGMPIDEDPVVAGFRQAHFAASVGGPAPLVPAGELGVVPGPVPGIPRVGAPVAVGGSSVSVAREPWVSERDGRYRAGPVPAGRLRVVVRHPQYVETISEVAQAEAGKETRIDVVLQRGGSLEGRILDARKRGVASARVTLLAVRGSQERETRTASDGSFAFAAVPTEVILIVARDETPTMTVARMVVEVPDGEKRSVEITIPDERPSLPVRVSARGRPVASAQVGVSSLDPASPARTTVFTDARGEALAVGVLGLPLRVEVHAPGYAAYVATSKKDDAELRVDLEPGEALEGDVYAELRAPVVGAQVTLHSAAGVLHTRTDKEGHFRVADLAPGAARLVIRAKGKTSFEANVTIAKHDGTRPTTVPRVELRDEGTVRGIVVDEKGEPVAGARVGKDTVPTYLPVGSLPPGLALTDARGRFELGGLPAGEIALEAYAAHLGRARKEGVRLIAGRVTEGVRIEIKHQAGASEPVAAGGVAVTLGETSTDGEAHVVIVAVAEGSAAERAGVWAGDVVVSVDGVAATSLEQVRGKLAGPVREDVLLQLTRGGRAVVLRVAREPVRR